MLEKAIRGYGFRGKLFGEILYTGFSKKGEEEYSLAMELMASQDLEELDKKVHHPYYGMVDGLRDKQSTLEKELILVHSTGLSIEELKNLANRDYNRRSKGSR